MNNTLLYTKNHEWLKLENNIATVGITEYAQKELGDIVYIEVDLINELVNANEVFGTIEAVKTVSDLYSPITGKLVEFNSLLEDEPELVNTNPYDKGWIVKFEISDSSNLSNLLNESEYTNLIQ